MERKRTKIVRIGDKFIGGNTDILIQSMCNTDTKNIQSTVAQILALEEAGCEMVRVGVPDMESAKAIGEIKKQIHIPLVADIHFDYRLALESMEQGVDKIRINPGNIGDEKRIEAVVMMAKEKKIPIRIGVNSGSLETYLIEKYHGVKPEAMVESALYHISLLEAHGFHDMIVSLKASDVAFTLKAYELLSEKIEYPLHIGITEAGTIFSGTIKSAVGIGALLAKGIGDTLRVSLTADPIEEIVVAKEILQSLGLRRFGIELISCPTCSRTAIDIMSIANEIEAFCKTVDKEIKVAVMGCVVNGPGEAKNADIGIAGGNGVGIIFKKGEILRKVPEAQLISVLKEEILNI